MLPDYWHQLGLDLPLAPHFRREDFLVSQSNAVALRMIEAWPSWPDHVLLLVGPSGAGKSHLAAIWAAQTAAEISFGRLLEGSDVAALAGKPALVLEGADEIGGAEAALFHLLNLVRQQKTSLLLTARRKPDLWGISTPDLLSRLRLAPVVELGAPDDVLLRAVLGKLFRDRQLNVDAGVLEFIALHIERSLDTARYFVDLLDRTALARGRPITRVLARELLQEFSGDEEQA
ncbi:MAG TPA: DnaA/Hda family protein [Methylovirgula sp.]|nr:DnaA/Hda family protein [Methylovirgula sp.]